MGNVSERIYLYALTETYHMVRYLYIDREDCSIGRLMLEADMLRNRFREVKYIFAADNSYELYEACRDAIRNNSTEDDVILKLLLEDRGMLIP